jgi:hypothetical protein
MVRSPPIGSVLTAEATTFITEDGSGSASGSPRAWPASCAATLNRSTRVGSPMPKLKELLRRTSPDQVPAMMLNGAA